MRVGRGRFKAALMLAGVMSASAWVAAAAPQVTNPRVRPPPLPEIPWVRKPTRMQLEGAYSDRALRRELNGWAHLRCTLRPDGGLTGCKVLREEPQGIEFGGGALSLVALYRVDLSTPAGQALVGQEVEFVVNFNVLR